MLQKLSSNNSQSNSKVLSWARMICKLLAVKFFDEFFLALIDIFVNRILYMNKFDKCNEILLLTIIWQNLYSFNKILTNLDVCLMNCFVK